jgi:hypothetical protein
MIAKLSCSCSLVFNSSLELDWKYPAGSGFWAEEKPLRVNKRPSIEHARRSRDGKSLIWLHFLSFGICKQAWHSTVVIFVVCQLYCIFLKFCIYPINIIFFNSGFELYLCYLNVGDCVKVFVKFQFPKFPNNIITFPVTVDFDNNCNFWSSRPQPLQISTDQRSSQRRYYFCKRLIFVAVYSYSVER